MVDPDTGQRDSRTHPASKSIGIEHRLVTGTLMVTPGFCEPPRDRDLPHPGRELELDGNPRGVAR